MYRFLLIISALILLAGCTKEIFQIDGPAQPVTNLPPGEFVAHIQKITDTKVVLDWSGAIDPENGTVSIDIAVSDSVIAYNLPDVGDYIIINLYPDTDYKISVIAHDKKYNSSQKDFNVKTFKSFLKRFYPIDFTYEEQYFFGSSETTDGGFITCGIVSPYESVLNDNFNFVAKIYPDYKVAWLKTFDWDFQGKMSVMECHDGTFLAVWTNTVIKLSQLGETIWKYKCSSEYKIEYFTSVTETANNEILLSGYKVERPLKYGVIKLDSSGKELWFKYGGTAVNNWVDFITTTNYGDILMLGQTIGASIDGIEQDVFKFFRLNENGELITQVTYPNKYLGSDVVYSIEPTNDGNYLLVGSTYAYLGGMGTDWAPHIIKVNANGEIVWEKFVYADDTGGGIFRIIRGFKKLDANNYLLFIEDDMGFSVANMNDAGEITHFKNALHYPNVRGFTINNSGQYVMLTDYGVFVFDQSGYSEYP